MNSKITTLINYHSKLILKFSLSLIFLFLAWRIFLYDWPEAKNVYGSLIPSSLYFATIGFWAVITGGWITAISFAILSITLLRSISKAKSDYVSSALEASDFKNIDFYDFLTTISQFPEIILKISIFIIMTLILGYCILRVSQYKRSVTRWVGLLIAVCTSYIANHHLKTPPDDKVMSSSVSLTGFVQTFYVKAADISSDAKQGKSPTFKCSDDPKNILLVLQESTFLPEALGKDLKGSMDDFFKQGELAGPLKVHVFGGFTHLSDFAIQTGLPHSTLTGDKMYTSKTLPGRLNHTLAKTLKNCGYETTVIHPITRSYFNARNWYQSVGFDRVISSEDLGHEPARYWSMPDKVFYDAARDIAEKFDQTTGKPQFIYVLTIAQHGPHDAKGDPNEEYLRRLKISAEAYMDLMQTLETKSSMARPWIAAWFGDHRPHLIEAHNQSERFLTWFNLRSLPATGTQVHLYSSPLDISFLKNMILERAGIRNQMSDDHIHKMMRNCSENYLNCSKDMIQVHHDLLRSSGAFAPAGP